MIVKQLSVFLENKNGRLCAAADILAQNGINLRALSLADTSDFGILRLIVDQPEEGKRVLMDAGIFVSVTDVLAIAIEDRPGGMTDVLHLLSENGISVEYMYVCIGHSAKKALMILQVDHLAEADRLTRERGLGEIRFFDLSAE